MAATGHHFEDVMATNHPPGIAGEVADCSYNIQWAIRQLWRMYWVRHFQRDVSSVFISVGDVDTPWLPQFISHGL